jgi:hypothetical protein
MYDALMRLEEPYQLAVNEEDMEKCLNYCRQAFVLILTQDRYRYGLFEELRGAEPDSQGAASFWRSCNAMRHRRCRLRCSDCTGTF